MNDLIKSNMRGVAEHGWLSSRHTFSFGQYFNPEYIGFSDLRVINDDWIAPGQGFGTHPHRDMEIFTYVLEGALEHRDSMGTGSVMRPGDVQVMAAGTGVTHSEFNHSISERVHLLQIWLLPAKLGTQPRYQQQFFTPEQKRGRLQLILSPNGAEGSLEIGQDARIYAGLFDGAETATLELPAHRNAYVHVARGELLVNGQRMAEGDGLRLREIDKVTLSEGNQAEVLVFDLRPHELPGQA